jgi:hypothetical protein
VNETRVEKKNPALRLGYNHLLIAAWHNIVMRIKLIQ